MELVSNTALKEATGIKSNRIISIIKKGTRLDELNTFYETVYSNESNECLNKIIDRLQLVIDVNENDLKNIPNEGGFITISNHPFGALDGIILLYLIHKVRPDYKLVANYLLQKIEPLKDAFIPINPFNNNKTDEITIGGYRKIIAYIQSDVPVGFFPAGEVSTWQSDVRKIADKKWDKSILRLIKKSEKPIVPIYFEGNNSVLFHALGIINNSFRTAKLPSEFLNSEGGTIKIRIGKTINVNENKSFDNADVFGRYLRARVYALQQPVEVKKFFNSIFNSKLDSKKESIALPISKEVMKNEIKLLVSSDLIVSLSKFEVYCVPVSKIPNIIKEIGRLREETFREVGEGTGKSLDIDEYDLYYQHLFIWDSQAQAIAGAYRIGKGKEIMARFGRKGFYLNSLFKWNETFDDIMNNAVELGRSFVASDYQKHPYSLFLLWKGIAALILNNNQYNYIVGPVSISNAYHTMSKDLLVSFIKNNYFDIALSKLVKARKKYKIHKSDSNISIELLNANDLDKLEKIIETIELGRMKVPVLLKKYLKQNAKIIGFNIDPSFNNSLDGLMILDFASIDYSKINDLTKS